MFRASLASVVLSACLASSGCALFDHPWFGCGSSRSGCCPAPAPCNSCNPCCDSGFMTGSSPIVEGPILTPQEPFAPVVNGSLPPLTNQPRPQPGPHSIP